MKGRKPKLEGGRGGAVGRCPTPPTWLTDRAKKEWKRTAPELQRRALLTPEATATLASYCIAVGQVQEAEEVMIAEGRYVETPDGGRKVHPGFRIQQAAMREARLLAAELALTPQRQGKLGKQEEGDDGWDDLLA